VVLAGITRLKGMAAGVQKWWRRQGNGSSGGGGGGTGMISDVQRQENSGKIEESIAPHCSRIEPIKVILF
jgi:hypothetical protein